MVAVHGAGAVMSPQTGIMHVRWWASPGALRILDYLACKGDADPETIATAVHMQPKYCYRMCSAILKPADRVHIVGWRHNDRGAPTPIYSIGPGKNKRQPRPETAAQRAKRRRISLTDIYGSSVTNRILNPGRYDYPRIYIDGQRITSGSHTSQLAGRITR